MKTERFLDRQGRFIGQTIESSDEIRLLDGHGKYLGSYHKSSGNTMDAQGKIIAYASNQLLRLLADK